MLFKGIDIVFCWCGRRRTRRTLNTMLLAFLASIVRESPVKHPRGLHTGVTLLHPGVRGSGS